MTRMMITIGALMTWLAADVASGPCIAGMTLSLASSQMSLIIFPQQEARSQLLNMMDQVMDNPFASSLGTTCGTRRGWDVFRVEMSGLGKENVKISAGQNTLVIKGEGEKESEEDEEGSRKYSSRVVLPPEHYNEDEIKAEMKNGVLKVVVPKVKQEERKDVIQVKVE